MLCSCASGGCMICSQGSIKACDAVHLWVIVTDLAALLCSQGSQKTSGFVQLSCQYLTMENKDDLLDAAAYQASPACLSWGPACLIWLPVAETACAAEHSSSSDGHFQIGLWSCLSGLAA